MENFKICREMGRYTVPMSSRLKIWRKFAMTVFGKSVVWRPDIKSGSVHGQLKMKKCCSDRNRGCSMFGSRWNISGFNPCNQDLVWCLYLGLLCSALQIDIEEERQKRQKRLKIGISKPMFGTGLTDNLDFYRGSCQDSISFCSPSFAFPVITNLWGGYW